MKVLDPGRVAELAVLKELRLRITVDRFTIPFQLVKSARHPLNKARDVAAQIPHRDPGIGQGFKLRRYRRRLRETNHSCRSRAGIE